MWDAGATLSIHRREKNGGLLHVPEDLVTARSRKAGRGSAEF